MIKSWFVGCADFKATDVCYEMVDLSRRPLPPSEGLKI